VTVDAASFKLVDEQNREFSHSTEGMTALQLSEKNKGFLTQLNPGMAILLRVVFDVSPEMPASKFKLQARGGFSGDKAVLPLEVQFTGY